MHIHTLRRNRIKTVEFLPLKKYTFTLKLFHNYKPFLDQILILRGNIQTVTDPVKAPQNAAFDQVQHCLLTGMSMQKKIKMKRPPGNLFNRKWTLPIDKDGPVYWSKIGLNSG